jgi:hypothetical protein
MNPSMTKQVKAAGQHMAQTSRLAHVMIWSCFSLIYGIRGKGK